MWKKVDYAQSSIEAKNKKEAKKLGELGKDHDFETQEDLGGIPSEWYIDWVEIREDDDE